MKAFPKFVISVVILCFTSPSWAYPIFYKCDGDRRMSEVLTGTEIKQKLHAILTLPPSQQRVELADLCAGVEECEQQLKQVLNIAKFDAAIAEKMFEQELKRLYTVDPTSPLKPLDENSFSTRQKIESAAFQVSACRNTIEDLPEQAFVHGTKAFIYYPHYNEYTYATGCKNSGVWNCNPVKKNNFDQAIRRALLAGADPYFALAIGIMEGGPEGVNALYLDPIGKYGAMGCKSKASDSGALYSFGNRHEIEPGVIHNPTLGEHIVDAIKANVNIHEAKSIPAVANSKSEKSYFCRDLSKGLGQIQETVSANLCCLQLPVSLSIAQGNEYIVENALVTEYVRQTQYSQLPGAKDPAYRIQHFNGFSHLMGGAEKVPVFRSGVDNYKTPEYGYQGMDYILNSLVSNPYIRARVDQISKETHAKYQSVLCQDVSVPGIYQVDSDIYFKKHRDSSRLSSLKARPWESLTHREKQVLLSELEHPKVVEKLQKKFPSLPSELQQHTFGENQVFGTVIKYQNGSGYVLSGYNGKKPEAFGNPKSSPPIIQEGSFGSIPIDPNLAKDQVSIKDTHGKNTKITVTSGTFPITSTQPLQELTNKQTPMTVSFKGGKVVMRYEKNSRGDYIPHPLKDDKSNSYMGFGFFMPMNYPIEIALDTGVKIRIEQSCDTQAAKAFVNQHFASYSVPAPGGTICDAVSNGSMFSTTNTVVYKDGEQVTVVSGLISHADLDQLEGRAPASPIKPASMQEVLKYYYMDILASRDTIGKASSFAPWGDLNDEQVKILRNNFQGAPIMEGVDQTKISTSPPTVPQNGMGGGSYGGGFPQPSLYPGFKAMGGMGATPTPASTPGGPQ